MIPLNEGKQGCRELLVRSIPGVLSVDHASVLKASESQAFTSVRALKCVSHWRFSSEPFNDIEFRIGLH